MEFFFEFCFVVFVIHLRILTFTFIKLFLLIFISSQHFYCILIYYMYFVVSILLFGPCFLILSYHFLFFNQFKNLLLIFAIFIIKHLQVYFPLLKFPHYFKYVLNLLYISTPHSRIFKIFAKIKTFPQMLFSLHLYILSYIPESSI